MGVYVMGWGLLCLVLVGMDRMDPLKDYLMQPHFYVSPMVDIARGLRSDYGGSEWGQCAKSCGFRCHRPLGLSLVLFLPGRRLLPMLQLNFGL